MRIEHANSNNDISFPNGWHNVVSETDWRYLCCQFLRQQLADYPAVSDALHICYYGVISKASVIAVFDTAWSLHIQCVVHGREEECGKYGLTPDKAFISLDFGERLPRSGCNITMYNRQAAREQILQAVTSQAELIPQASLRRQDYNDEHLVWETINITKSGPDGERVAGRMAAYIHALMPAATLALQRLA